MTADVLVPAEAASVPADVLVPAEAASMTAMRFEVADGVHVALAPTAQAPEVEGAAARALLRRLLAEVAGRDAGATPLAARPGGQPFLPERPDLTVSLSHSGGWVAAAVGLGPDVGVDVQVPQPASAALLRRCCGPAARRALAAMPPRRLDEEFAWIWTVQEACVKATGSGLAGRPWTIPVGVGQRAGTWRRVRWLSLRDRVGVPVSCAYGHSRPVHRDGGAP